MKINNVQKNDYSFRAREEKRHKPNRAQRLAAREEDREMLRFLKERSDSYLKRVEKAAEIGIVLPVPEKPNYFKGFSFVAGFLPIRNSRI